MIRRGLGGEPATLDPAQADDNAALAVAADLFEGVTAEAADGAIVPGAAARWSVTPDGLRWSFELRPGLRWSNGEPLAAQDFTGAWDAVRDAASTSPYASLLKDVARVRAIDDARIEITTTRPMPQLPAILALPFASPRLRGAPADGRVSNGPYRLVARTPGESLHLERNPHFHAAGSVAITQVRYLTVADLGTELNLYRAGDLDVTSEVPNAQLDWIRRNLPGELQLAPYLSTYGYAVNLRRLPASTARKALVLAVDRERIVTKVTGAGELPAFSWVPPGIPGYVPPLFAWRGQPQMQRESAASRLWPAASRASSTPRELRLCTDASANHRRTAIALADAWRRTLGIETEIVELEWKAYLAQREQPGDCDLLRFGWSADYVDPEAFLALFASGHPQNVSGYSNARYDALLRDATLATTHERRNALLAEAESVLLDDGVVIPVFHRVAKRLVKPYVAGVTPNPLGHLQSRHLHLQQTKK
jgi:oligopeptide transport system substrate-binding protein